MAATSLKISDELKSELERIAAREHKTPHAYMVDVLTRDVERKRLQERFAADAAQAEAEALHLRKSISLNDAFAYIDPAKGARVRRPRPKRWPKSS
jgi:predicted transcriptional regulator